MLEEVALGAVEDDLGAHRHRRVLACRAKTSPSCRADLLATPSLTFQGEAEEVDVDVALGSERVEGEFLFRYVVRLELFAIERAAEVVRLLIECDHHIKWDLKSQSR